MLRALRVTKRTCSRAAHDETGATAIEFALIAPLLLMVLVAGTEITQAVMAARKVATATRTVADLTAQIQGTTPVTPTMVDEVFAAARLIITPYPADSLKVTISRVDVKNVNNVPVARTVWTAPRNGGTPRPCTALNRIANAASPSADAFPEGMYYEGRFIVADVTYIFGAPLTRNFAPNAFGFGGWQSTAEGILIRRTAYMQMRIDGNPTMTGAGACPVS